MGKSRNDRVCAADEIGAYVDAKRVAALRVAVKRGTYQVGGADVAAALLLEHLRFAGVVPAHVQALVPASIDNRG